MRSLIVLAAAEGVRNTEIAEHLGITRAISGKWRRGFAGERLDGLTDDPRPGRPRTVTDAQVEAVITATLERTPKDATHPVHAAHVAEHPKASGTCACTGGRIIRIRRRRVALGSRHRATA